MEIQLKLSYSKQDWIGSCVWKKKRTEVTGFRQSRIQWLKRWCHDEFSTLSILLPLSSRLSPSHDKGDLQPCHDLSSKHRNFSRKTVPLPKTSQLISWFRNLSDGLSPLPTAEPITVNSDWPECALGEMGPHRLGPRNSRCSGENWGSVARRRRNGFCADINNRCPLYLSVSFSLPSKSYSFKEIHQKEWWIPSWHWAHGSFGHQHKSWSHRICRHEFWVWQAVWKIGKCLGSGAQQIKIQGEDLWKGQGGPLNEQKETPTKKSL